MTVGTFDLETKLSKSLITILIFISIPYSRGWQPFRRKEPFF